MRTETTYIPAHTVTTTYYQYDELNDDAKEKIKNWCLRERAEWGMFSEDVKQDLENLFGKNDLDIEYSLNYSQGDGLNIYGEIDAEKVLDFMGSNAAGDMSLKYADVLSEDEKNIIRGYCNYDNGYWHDYGKIIAPKNPYSYTNCRASSIDIADSWTDELEYCGVTVDYDLLKKFENAVIDLFTELCDMYKKWGYEFFYEISDEEMSETCDANGWEFDEDGEFM